MPAPVAPDPEPRPSFSSYEVAAAVVLAWVLGLVRVAFGLHRHEPPSRELDFAWILVALAPLLVWKDIASQRRP